MSEPYNCPFCDPFLPASLGRLPDPRCPTCGPLHAGAVRAFRLMAGEDAGSRRGGEEAGEKEEA